MSTSYYKYLLKSQQKQGHSEGFEAFVDRVKVYAVECKIANDNIKSVILAHKNFNALRNEAFVREMGLDEIIRLGMVFDSHGNSKLTSEPLKQTFSADTILRATYPYSHNHSHGSYSDMLWKNDYNHEILQDRRSNPLITLQTAEHSSTDAVKMPSLMLTATHVGG